LTSNRAPGTGRLLYFAIAYGGTAALQKALGFAVFMWLAHSLPVKEYGTFGLVYALQVALATFAGAGIVESVIGALKGRGNFDLRTGLYGAANSAFAILGAAAVLVVLAVYAFFLLDDAVSLLMLAGVVVSGLLTAYAILQANMLRLEENHVHALVLGFLVPLGGFAGAIVAFLLDPGVASFFTGTSLGMVLVSFVLAFLRIGFYRISHPRGMVSEILRRIAPFIFIAVLSWIGGYGNTYLVDALFDAEDVARFTFAFTVSAVMLMVATSLNQVWAPRFYRLVNELPRDALELRNRRFFVFQGFALGMVGALVLLVFPGAMRVVGGNLLAYQDLTVELLLLFAAYAVSIPWWHAQNYFFANNQGHELMNVTIVGSIAGLLAWVAAALAWGVIGVYAGFFLQMLARSLAAFIAARRHWGVRLQWEGVVLSVLLMCAGAAASMAIY
jgi:O-antigen/teichoic acid export membrane protein